MALLIANGHIVTGDAADSRLTRGDLLIVGNRIAMIGRDLGSEAATFSDLETIDARRSFVMPGLINAHIHSNEGFEQGAYDNLPLELWLLESYPPWGMPRFSERQHYLRTMLTAIEAIRSGTTTLQDDLFHRHFAKWHGHAGRLSIVLGPCGPQRCTDELLMEATQLSRQHGIGVHSHVLETRTQAVTAQQLYNNTMVEHMHDLGVLTPRLTINHGIWLTQREIELLGAAGCSVTHNPLSNMKLGSGVCPVRRLLEAGANLALGTDGRTTR